MSGVFVPGAPLTATTIRAMADYRQLVAVWIGENRKVLKMTAAELGAAIDRTGETVRNWENGIGNITLFDALALQHVFNQRWSELGKRHMVTPEEKAVRDLPLPPLRNCRRAEVVTT